MDKTPIPVVMDTTPSQWDAVNTSTMTSLFGDVTMETALSSGGGGFPGNGSSSPRPAPGLSGEVRIPLYTVIFILAVGGNTLVIVTLAQNRRMRTVTNVFLLNLSVSDLLLALFCMPFTLIPTLLQDFIFGQAMCVLIRYIQAVSVAVSVFTLVSISLERYFAICQPLRSRSWQTLSHSYKIITVVWLVSLVIMVPVAAFQRLLYMPHRGTHKCIEIWSDQGAEKFYTLFLVLVLLVLPLILMLLAYGKISLTLWKGIQLEMRSVQEMTELRNPALRPDGDVDTDDEACRYDNNSVPNGRRPTGGASSLNGINNASASSGKKQRCMDIRQQHIRHSNTEKSLQAKKRVIKMLFVVVVEFFVCWTPTYILQTWYVFDYSDAMLNVSAMAMNFIHLLSYVSSCCNPITYCFMNRKFRQGFLSVFQCCPLASKRRLPAGLETSFAVSQRTDTQTMCESTYG